MSPTQPEVSTTAWSHTCPPIPRPQSFFGYSAFSSWVTLRAISEGDARVHRRRPRRRAKGQSEPALGVAVGLRDLTAYGGRLTDMRVRLARLQPE